MGESQKLGKEIKEKEHRWKEIKHENVQCFHSKMKKEEEKSMNVVVRQRVLC